MDKVLQLARNIFELISTEDLSPEEQQAALRIARELLDLKSALTDS